MSAGPSNHPLSESVADNGSMYQGVAKRCGELIEKWLAERPETAKQVMKMYEKAGVSVDGAKPKKNNEKNMETGQRPNWKEGGAR